MIQLLHTPEGVRDYYNNENARKLGVCAKIRSVFELFGYQEIQTPAFEYFDIFNAERGSVSSRDMYKFFDRDGETLVLRPDFTPSIARCAAKYFSGDSLPVRLSYLGNTYVNNNSLRGTLKESMQAGVELVGDPSVDANVEALALVITCLKNIGLERFQIEVGDVRYFNGLLDEAGIPDDVRQELRLCIENKNRFGLEELMEKHRIPAELSRVLTRLPQMFGDPQAILEEARALADNTASLTAVDRLEELYKKMGDYGMSSYISFDLGMLGTHDYYTGIIFKGYTYGTGESIVSGGRYDNLIAQFGKDAPSVGFGISIDVLLQAMDRQGIALPGRKYQTLVMYDASGFSRAVAEAQNLRLSGTPATLLLRDGRDLSEYADYVMENEVNRVIVMNNDGSNEVYTADPETGSLRGE